MIAQGKFPGRTFGSGAGGDGDKCLTDPGNSDIPAPQAPEPFIIRLIFPDKCKKLSISGKVFQLNFLLSNLYPDIAKIQMNLPISIIFQLIK